MVWHLFCLLGACEILDVPFSRRTMTGLRGRPIWTSWSSARPSVRCCTCIRATPGINTGWAWPAGWAADFLSSTPISWDPTWSNVSSSGDHNIGMMWAGWSESRGGWQRLSNCWSTSMNTGCQSCSYSAYYMEKRRLWGDFTVVSQYLKGACRKAGDRIFTRICSNKARVVA